jgi:hypothetical protein
MTRLLTFPVLVLCAAALAAQSAPASAHATPAAAAIRGAPRDPLVGTWRFVDVTDWDTDAAPTHPLGEHPCGYLIYTATGQVSAHLGTCDGPADERVYGGYFGTYAADTARHLVTHRIEGGNDPADVGTAVARPYRIRGDTLELGDGRTWRRLLVRVTGP